MDAIIFFDINKFITHIYDLLKKDVQFTFPNDVLDRNRVHQTLSRIMVVSKILKKNISDNYFQLNDLESLFFKKTKANFQSIISQVNFVYPKNNLDIDNSWPALCTIQSLVANYYHSDQLLNDYLFKKDEKNICIPIDLFHVLDHFDCKNEYDYAFEKNMFQTSKAHVSLQCLSVFSLYFHLFLSNIQTNDSNIKNFIDSILDKFNDQFKIIATAYTKPNGAFDENLSFNIITQYYANWKKIKNDISDLKNYLESIHFDFQSINKNITPEQQQLLKNKAEFEHKIKSVL
jgi:hypothetical protein